MADVETVGERYEREWLSLNDDRKVRGFDYQSAERRSREFVDPATVGQDGGEVTGRFENTPDGFNQSEFEEGLVYNPNA